MSNTEIAPMKNGRADFGFIDKTEITDKKEQLAAIDKLNPKCFLDKNNLQFTGFVLTVRPNLLAFRKHP